MTQPAKDRFDRLPPHDVLAEAGLIGSLLLSNDKLDDVSTIVRPEHFYRDDCRRMFEGIQRLREKRSAFDPVTLASMLGKRGELAEIGGIDKIHEVLNGVPHSAHAKHYAEIVREKWAQRSLISACNDCLREAYDEGERAEDVLAKASERIFALSESVIADDTSISMRDLMVLHQDLLNLRAEGKDRGIPSGFRSLDAVTQGFQPGTVTIIAARPGVGKTALLCNLLRNMADCSPLFFSLEQPKLQIADRLVASMAGVSLDRVRAGNFDESERERLFEAASNLSLHKITIDDRAGRTVQQIGALSRIQKRKTGTKLVVIDYLQLIAPADRKQPREQQVGDMSRGLAELAKNLDVPIICLAQMNREVDKRGPKDKRPRLSDLRESGSVEQDAFLILFLDVPSQYDADAEPTAARLYIAKNRDGRVGQVDLQWDRETVTFSEPPLADAFTAFTGGFMGESEYGKAMSEFGRDEQPQYRANY